jgi:hypothetical protein
MPLNFCPMSASLSGKQSLWECLLCGKEQWRIQARVTYTCNLGTGEAEAGRSGVHSWSGPQRKLETSLGLDSATWSQKKKKKRVASRRGRAPNDALMLFSFQGQWVLLKRTRVGRKGHVHTVQRAQCAHQGGVSHEFWRTIWAHTFCPSW